MRGLRPLLLLLLLLLLSLLSPCSAHESASAALFHDRSPLLALEELTEVSSAVADERTRWGLSDNVAHYLGLRRLLSFSLPVHVNLIFIGFHGDGNGFLTLNQADFAAWFEHMEHELEHVVAPVGETQTTTDENETPDSSVRYRFLVDVLHLSPLVNTIVEDTIVWGLASEEPPEADQPDDQHTDDHGEYHYADAMRMSGLLRDLLIHLNLTNSYTFFVLNPKNPVGHGETYGYRYGFSDEDIEVVRQHAHEIRVEWPPPKPAPRKSNLTADVESKLEFRDLFAESEKWANEYIAQFRIAKEPVDCSSEQWSENIRCRTRPGAGRSVMERADLISHYGTLEEKRYLQRILDLNATVNEQCLTDVWISRERFAFLDLTAGPFSWGPNVAGEGVRTEETLPRVPVSSAGAPAKAYAGAKAEATELTEAIEKYKSHCSMMHPDSDPNEKLSPYCSDLVRRIETLEKAEAKKHTEDWASQLVGSDEEGEADPADSVEQVMWRLSATLANGVRALLAPPSGLYSTPLTSHIVFQAIVVTNPGLPYKISDHFKWEMFKEQITSLGLPGQDITFTFNEQSLSIASELSMAFRLSLRTHVIPTLNSEGGFKATPQTFVDSHVFRELLGPRNLRTSATVPVVTNSSGELRLRTSLVQRTIPIYVFAVGTEYGPLLVDRYYQAKALSDMVVVVMSDFSDYESRLSCNGQAIYWDLRDPLKALLSATGLVLGGLVPLHVGYNHPRHRTTQDWLWSVGDSPLSHTSSGARFNQIQRDIVHRNYIREHVDAALAHMDEAIEWLVEEATEDSDYDYVAPTLTLYWTELRELYATVTGTLSALGREVAHVDFAAAAPLVPKLDSAVASFHALAQHVSGLSHLFRCSARTAVATEKAAKSINWGVIAALVLLDASVVAMALFALKRKRKIKVN